MPLTRDKADMVLVADEADTAAPSAEPASVGPRPSLRSGRSRSRGGSLRGAIALAVTVLVVTVAGLVGSVAGGVRWTHSAQNLEKQTFQATATGISGAVTTALRRNIGVGAERRGRFARGACLYLRHDGPFEGRNVDAGQPCIERHCACRIVALHG